MVYLCIVVSLKDSHNVSFAVCIDNNCLLYILNQQMWQQHNKRASVWTKHISAKHMDCIFILSSNNLHLSRCLHQWHRIDITILRNSIMPPFSNVWHMADAWRVIFIACKLFVNPACSGCTTVWCDTTFCYLLVLSKTGTCFSQSGTFSSRRHPINLGINSRACATMAMLTEWRLPCHFRFVPRRESIHAVCLLADLPELAH